MVKVKLGIQGGKGSFNEQASRIYVNNNPENEYEIIYLYNTANVFNELQAKNIDEGLFAILNGVGGVVEESIQAISQNNFEIVDTVNLPISHHLMKHKESNEVKAVMAHPQVFKQCKDNLEDKYPDLPQVIGEGDFIDHAKVVEALSKKQIDVDTAVLGPSILAEIYNLDIIDHDLQDSSHNVTSFMVIKA